ncbi:unnamed protein product [Albugo candida]|uniref:Uncharacterized protein n=1 Tax=Albugo candida TaxID=65357 RepID=A0A024FX73_9STRA|nr:unnamed protein product [Albugo candida]|eukprot:CCI11621.1 unnamed protein product [Albugo candida]
MKNFSLNILWWLLYMWQSVVTLRPRSANEIKETLHATLDKNCDASTQYMSGKDNLCGDYMTSLYATMGSDDSFSSKPMSRNLGLSQDSSRELNWLQDFLQ